MSKLNIDKIIKNVNEAIAERDYEKLMELKDIIDSEIEKDEFRVWLYEDKSNKVKLRINKDFQQIELNEEECIEVFKQLDYANQFNWKIPF